MKKIRNFCIIAHIDHGKSTLADCILEETGALSKREMKNQILDDMDIERERGITIKLNAVTLNYKYNDQDYILNLIDTPGHVDFSYEVSRSLAACEGAVLVVDAAQGVEAQTLANLYLALDNGLDIIPVINKIDLPNADVEKVTKELENIGFKKEEIILTSAKKHTGIKELLEAIILRVKEPNTDISKPLQALIFDSVFDPYKGVITSVRIKNGILKVHDQIYMMNSKASYEVLDITVNTPKEEKRAELLAGEVGYVYASIKSIEDVSVGDTITLLNNKAPEPLAGYKEMKPMVYSGIYPTISSKFEDLREALGKLKLNDAALRYEPETSKALGFGFRCGFLGLLHMEIVIERIEREFGIDLIATSPSVNYEIELTSKKTMMIDSPYKMPDKSKIAKIKEPYVKCSVYTPSEYIGPIMELCQEKRGIFKNMDYLDEKRVCIVYEMPMAEILYDFFDRLKSYTKGYASFDYELIGNQESNLVKLDILLNGEVVDALSTIVHKDFAYNRGRSIVEKLRTIIPRQLFEVPIQASIGSKVIARENIKALRKNVLAKCYGGDITRKKKLLEKQKAGKKKMKQIGSIEVPSDTFIKILSTED
ncbi:MAG: translation elongation factor 4 [Bacilli bacterium]|nr:translation elongation factor 4 [Bacilli bacterium]